MQRTFQILFTETWWTYDPGDRSLHAVWYHGFNLVEGVAWLIFAGMVLIRFTKYRRSKIELAYAAAFAVFGLTDFREAYALQSWLLWLKFFVLIALFCLSKVSDADVLPGEQALLRVRETEVLGCALPLGRSSHFG